MRSLHNGNGKDGDFSTSELDTLFEWVRLDTSLVRNNVPCIENHQRSLRANGETEQRLSELAHWRRSNVFNEREKAALRLCETISAHESEELTGLVLKEVQSFFSTEEIVRLTLNVMAVNDWIDLQEKSSIRVLVVEDNPDDQELLRHQLRKIQMEDNVLFLSNGTQALEYMEESMGAAQFGLIAIFLDIHLPGMNGIELLQRIRAITGMESFPVIMVSSSSDPRHLEECKRLNVVGYVQKPITFQTFARAVANIFHSAKGCPAGA